MEQWRAVAACGFVLTENERISTASELRDGVLICRPFRVARWQNVLLVVVSLIASGQLLRGLGDETTPATFVARTFLAVALAGASIGWAVAFARSEVRADPKGLAIRDRWRTRRFGWDEIAGFDVVERKTPFRWFGDVTAGFTWHAWPNEAVPVVRLNDGREHPLLPLTSTAASNGWSLGDVTVAASRAALLARYHAAHR